MSRRIEIELTSTRPDGSWTWRQAGAREPKGVLDGSVLPEGSTVGDVLRAEADVEIDGITILSVTSNKAKSAKSNVVELLPSDRPFQAVTQQLAERRGPRRDGDRPRREGDRDRPRRDGDRPRRDGDRDRPRREGGPHQAADRDRPRRERREPRPHFEAPPELPQRPKPKRLKPGRVHRNAVVADLPEEQRPVAERVLQGGIPAVRQAVQEQNARLRAEGKPEVGSGLVQMAEQLLPRLRVAEWLDRADAAKRDLEELDLRDLRSVVTAADDPLVARDEHTRELAAELKQALLEKQEREYQQWLGDIEAAVGVGRVIRALKLSGQPPKAGVPFPAEAAERLAAATLAALEPTATADRWSALLEAVAFSPVRTLVVPTAKPEQVTDDLLTTVKRVGSLVPKVAELFGVEPKTGGLPPRPLRPTRPNAPAGKKPQGPPPKPPKPVAAAKETPTAVPAEETPVAEEPTAAAAAEETPVIEEPTAAAAAEETPVIEEPTAAAAAEETPVIEEPTAAAAAEETPVIEEPTAAAAAEETPVIEEPTAAAAAEETPVIEEPTAAAAAEETPVIEEPTAAAAAEETPVIEEPTAAAAAEETPVIEEPTAAAAAEETPVIEEPTAAAETPAE